MGVRFRALTCVLLAAVACSVGSERELERTYDAGQQALRHGNLKEAAAAASRGLERTRELTDSFWAWTFRLFQAELHLADENAGEARPLLAAAPPEGDDFARLRGRQAYLRGRLSLAEGTPAEALTALDRARGLVAENDDTRLDIDALAGQVHFRLARWAEGDALLNSVLTRAAASEDRYHEAVVLNDMGMARLVRNRCDDALAWFERVIGRRDLEPFDHYVRALNNAGICYARLGQFEEARAAQTRAVDIRRKQGAVLELERTLGSLGNTYYLQGNFREGLAHYEEAHAVATKGSLLQDAALWAGNLSSVYVQLGEWDLAERYNDDARRLKEKLGSGLLAHNTMYGGQIAHGRGRQDEARRLFRLALDDRDATPGVKWSAHAMLGLVEASARRPDEAARHFQAALDIIEKTRSDLIRTEYRLTFLTSLIEFYRAFVDVLVREGRIERALEVAESSRGRLLAERQGVAAPAPTAASRFRAVAEQSNAVLLSYWLAPERSYLWIVTRDGARLAALPPANEIENLVREHQRTIESALADPLATPGGSGDRLYRLLVAPAQSALAGRSRVIVAADGALHRLNFETLPVDGPRRHYLIEDFEVQVAPSLTLLADARRRPDTPPSLLLIGNPTPREPDFPALSYAAAEMTGIARHFPREQVTAMQAEHASPAGYADARPDRFTMIHFTAHATANADSPLDSAVILSGPDMAYRLYARDLVSNTSKALTAELVTVSACRSAGERAYSGEGLIGFAWAFLRAGARRVVAGLWDVDDRSTADLMDRFYKGVASGDRPAAALRQAKLVMTSAGGTYAKPYYWGAFQMFTLTP